MPGARYELKGEDVRATRVTLNRLEEDIKEKATRQIVNTTANEAVQHLRAEYPKNNARRGPDARSLRPHIRDMIAKRTVKFRDGMGYVSNIGYKGQYQPHAHLLERGTDKRSRYKKGIGGWVKDALIRSKRWRDSKHGPGGTNTGTGRTKEMRPFGRAADRVGPRLKQIAADIVAKYTRKP